MHTHMESDGAADDVKLYKVIYKQPRTFIMLYLHFASLKNSSIGTPRLIFKTRRIEKSHIEEKQTPQQ